MKAIRIAYLGAFLVVPFLASAQVFNFLLSGSQEVSLATKTGSAGYAMVELSGNNLNWMITYTGTTATNAHFHGPALAGQNANPALGIAFGASPMSGNAVLTGQQVTDLTNGNWYLNLHTAANTGGELRGQVENQLPFTPNTLLSGSQVTGGNLVASAGAALVTFNTNTNLLSWEIAYEGLEGTMTNMHFHGPAGPGVNAGVRVSINPTTTGQTSGMEAGSQTLSDPQQIDDLLNGLWYINIHSTAYAGGEIRGQVVNLTIVPEPSTIALLLGLVAMGACLFLRRPKQS